jgi:hypothetical protein
MNIQKELQIVDEFNSFPGLPSEPRYDTPITPRENFMRSMRHEELWTPMTTELLVLSPRINPDNIARGFVLDVDGIDNMTQAGGPDMFGVLWEWVPQVWGSMVRPDGKQLLSDVADWENAARFPDPSEWDWEGSAARNAHLIRGERATMVWFQNGLFERLISFMGFENAALAFIDEKQRPYVHSLFDRLCGLYEDIFVCFKKYYKADILYFHDDWGGQLAPFFSEKMAREMLLPYLKRLIDFSHGLDMYFDFHCCGKNEILVPVMIDAGVDIWSGQPINDHSTLLEKYTGRIRFEVGLDIPFGARLPADETETLVNGLLTKFDPYLGSVIFANYIGTPEGKARLYEMVYRRSREKLSR